MPDHRRAVKVRVTRAGQTEPVRRTAGLIFDSAAEISDVLVKALHFGSPPLDDLVIADALESLQRGGVEVILSDKFLPASETSIEEANCFLVDAMEMWDCNSIHFHLPKVERTQTARAADTSDALAEMMRNREPTNKTHLHVSVRHHQNCIAV